MIFAGKCHQFGLRNMLKQNYQLISDIRRIRLISFYKESTHVFIRINRESTIDKLQNWRLKDIVLLVIHFEVISLLPCYDENAVVSCKADENTICWSLHLRPTQDEDR